MSVHSPSAPASIVPTESAYTEDACKALFPLSSNTDFHKPHNRHLSTTSPKSKSSLKSPRKRPRRSAEDSAPSSSLVKSIKTESQNPLSPSLSQSANISQLNSLQLPLSLMGDPGVTLYSPNDGNGDMSASPTADNPNKRKRKTPDQLAILESQFRINPMPDKQVRDQLGFQLGLSSRQVQIWFQNKRAKVKNEQKTAEQIAARAIHMKYRGLASSNGSETFETSDDAAANSSSPSDNSPYGDQSPWPGVDIQRVWREEVPIDPSQLSVEEWTHMYNVNNGLAGTVGVYENFGGENQMMTGDHDASGCFVDSLLDQNYLENSTSNSSESSDDQS